MKYNGTIPTSPTNLFKLHHNENKSINFSHLLYVDEAGKVSIRVLQKKVVELLQDLSNDESIVYHLQEPSTILRAKLETQSL